MRLDRLLDHRDHRVLRILLDHHHANTPGPTIPKWEAEAERGFTNSEWHPCPTCHGTGELNTRRGIIRCTNAKCQGHGGWRGDQYDTEARTITVETADLLDTETYAAALLDWLRTPGAACWKLCRDTHARRGAIADPHDFAAQLRDLASQTALTQEARAVADWREHIAAALERLADKDPFAALAVKREHILNDLPWRLDNQNAYRQALTRIGRLLPPGFRAPRWARQQAAEDRAA